jgi:hypothetical protein
MINPITVAIVGINAFGIGRITFMISVMINTTGTAITASQKFV